MFPIKILKYFYFFPTPILSEKKYVYHKQILNFDRSFALIVSSRMT